MNSKPQVAAVFSQLVSNRSLGSPIASTPPLPDQSPPDQSLSPPDTLAPRPVPHPDLIPDALKKSLSLAELEKRQAEYSALGDDLPRAMRCLDAIVMHCSCSKGIADAGVSWPECMRWRAQCPAWAREWHAAQEIVRVVRAMKAVDALHERAVEGWLEPIYAHGEVIGTVRRYSDRLLELQLAADDPARFGRQQAEAGQGMNVTINLGNLPGTRRVLGCNADIIDS